MELKGRLKLIADKVPKCRTACDIGTDHAYIPIYLILNKICLHAIAADIKKGPIAAADENIKSYKLNGYIETRLGDGLGPVGENEADVIIVAGIGGTLMKDILNKGLNKAKNAEFLVLQPMNAIENLREWLYCKEFDIIDEELVSEGRKIYNVIIAKWTGNKKSVNDVNYYIGEKLIQKRDPLLKRLLLKKIRQMDEVIKGLEKSINRDAELDKKCRRLRDEYSKIYRTL